MAFTPVAKAIGGKGYVKKERRMTSFEIYTFVLCLIVYVLLTGVFFLFLACVSKQTIRLIRGGLEDEKIYAEYLKSQKTAKKNSGNVGSWFSAIFCCIMIIVFAFATYVNLTENKRNLDIPAFRVVQSASMSKKYEKNKYLFDNNLNNQIQTFDLIITEKMPDEFDLKLYDIVVYEVDDTLIVHRIVGIEEPNENHPNQRYFRFQGDNVHITDKFPVKYEQMRGIYRGVRIPFIGSFVLFMQSPAGVLCLLLVIFGVVATPIVEKKIQKEKDKRLAFLKEQKATQAMAKQVPTPGPKFAPFSYVLYPVCPPIKGNVVYPNTTLPTSTQKSDAGKSSNQKSKDRRKVK